MTTKIRITSETQVKWHEREEMAVISPFHLRQNLNKYNNFRFLTYIYITAIATSAGLRLLPQLVSSEMSGAPSDPPDCFIACHWHENAPGAPPQCHERPTKWLPPGPEWFTWRKSPVHPYELHNVLLKVKQTRQQCKLSCQMYVRISSPMFGENSLYIKITGSRFCSMASIHNDSRLSSGTMRLKINK